MVVFFNCLCIVFKCIFQIKRRLCFLWKFYGSLKLNAKKSGLELRLTNFIYDSADRAKRVSPCSLGSIIWSAVFELYIRLFL